MTNIEEWLDSLSEQDFNNLKYCECSEIRSQENLIKFCPDCGHNIFYEIVSDFIDYTICEKKILCKRCNSIVNYWSYGYYDNDISDKYKIMLRRKKIERII